MKRIIAGILFAVSIFIGGCVTNGKPSPDKDFGTPPKHYKVEIKKQWDLILKDPYTAKYIYKKPIKGYANIYLNGPVYWEGWAVPVAVNAKNSYGGYIGMKNYIFLLNGEKPYTYLEGKDIYLVKIVN